MRLRLRKPAPSNPSLSNAVAENLRRRVDRVKKNKHPKEMRMFKQRLQLAVRIAIGVLLADVVQTRGSDREWLLLPSSFYLGGLTVASMMVIYAASNTVGGVLEQVWQIDSARLGYHPPAACTLYTSSSAVTYPKKRKNICCQRQPVLHIDNCQPDESDIYHSAQR
ncbi:unnamed protein product [Peronospora destructor]|uniref:CASP-like protein n=1 Tax=Peronospora destructor TaxID=86335 RepID=A0AAV0SW31_9STRA|nr:unnamed protein product [Peronospora destructor]